MIVLFTDFGVVDPYLGQMQAAIYRHTVSVPVINLVANAPPFNPVAAGYLLAAYVNEFPPGTVFLCVVDPGVGSERRRPIVANIDQHLFVGPENGLFDVVALRAERAVKRPIVWRPELLSNSFHGRDLFAPVAARLAVNDLPDSWLGRDENYAAEGIAAELDEIIYIDHYGNAMTGRRAHSLGRQTVIEINGNRLSRARTFSDVAAGRAFWYENANGLVEIAVNCGNAARQLSLKPGDKIGLDWS